MTSALAEVIPPSFSLPLIVWLGIVACLIPTLVATLNGVLSIIKFFRKQPPDHAVYAAKADLEKLAVATKADVKSLEQRLSQMASKEDVQGLERRVGLTSSKLELQAVKVDLKSELKDDFAAVKEDRKEMERRITDRLDNQDKMTSSVRTELGNVHEQLGKLFGLLEGSQGTRGARPK